MSSFKFLPYQELKNNLAVFLEATKTITKDINQQDEQIRKDEKTKGFVYLGLLPSEIIKKNMVTYMLYQ